MYEELVKELRRACEDERYGGKHLYLSLINRSADAIEELAFYIVNHPMWSDEPACVVWLKIPVEVDNGT